MSLWKVLAVVALLAFPAAYVVGDLASRPDAPPARPAIVLATPGVGTATTQATPPADGPSSTPTSPLPTPTPDPSGTRTPDPDGCDDDGDDEGDDDDDGVIVVHPCPEDVGDDEGDDDRGGDRED